MPTFLKGCRSPCRKAHLCEALAQVSLGQWRSLHNSPHLSWVWQCLVLCHVSLYDRCRAWPRACALGTQAHTQMPTLHRRCRGARIKMLCFPSRLCSVIPVLPCALDVSAPLQVCAPVLGLGEALCFPSMAPLKLQQLKLPEEHTGPGLPVSVSVICSVSTVCGLSHSCWPGPFQHQVTTLKGQSQVAWQ